ncbi:hypothetical protein WMY93_027269 [Mugilogobius chulae]|uniref:Uncharacterized protein n=1 Tax=Mugilogobius chulae TaxID=88201 RepID=A0AAW0MU72_9GOBI
MEVRASIEEPIKEAEWFGATTDVWTSSGGSEQVHQLLQPLNELTDVMASEKQVTLSSLKPVLEHINKRIFNEKEGDSALTKQMKKAVRDDLLLSLRYSEEMDFCSKLHKPAHQLLPHPIKRKGRVRDKAVLIASIVTADANPLSWWKMHLEECHSFPKWQKVYVHPSYKRAF